MRGMTLSRQAFAVLVLSALAAPALGDMAPGPRDVTEEAARSACIEHPDSEAMPGSCTVSGFGPLGSVEGHDLFYGLYAYHAADGDFLLRTDVAVYERETDGRLRVLFAPEADAVFYDKPAIIETGGRVLLHLPGYESGTGDFNRERLYLWRDAAWQEVDTAAWLSELAKRLPKGFAVWKGVFPDYRKMTAATPVWRESDGNCCPTGGRADIALGWQGDRIIVKSVRFTLGAKAAGQF